jgi:hypothetical protein
MGAGNNSGMSAGVSCLSLPQEAMRKMEQIYVITFFSAKCIAGPVYKTTNCFANPC